MQNFQWGKKLQFPIILHFMAYIDIPSATDFLSDGYPEDLYCACSVINKKQRAKLWLNPKSFKINSQDNIKTQALKNKNLW